MSCPWLEDITSRCKTDHQGEWSVLYEYFMSISEMRHKATIPGRDESNDTVCTSAQYCLSHGQVIAKPRHMKTNRIAMIEDLAQPAPHRRLIAIFPNHILEASIVGFRPICDNTNMQFNPHLH